MAKKTVTIGIPAHNAALNIVRLMRSILEQKAISYQIDKIYVACDGCSDNTAEVVTTFIAQEKSKVVRLINDGKRVGKSQRLNQFYKRNRSDIFIVFDDDLLLANENTIEELVNNFKNKKIGLVGGRDTAYPAKNFFEKIVVTSDRLWYETRKDINGGDSVHNHISRVSALSYEMTKLIRIPTVITGDDEYLYFRILQLHRKFVYAQNALVYYFVPENLRDFLVQSTRFLRFKNSTSEFFGSWVDKYYKVPTYLKIRAIIKMFLKEPIFLPLAIGLQILVRLLQNKYQRNQKAGIWNRINFGGA